MSNPISVRISPDTIAIDDGVGVLEWSNDAVERLVISGGPVQLNYYDLWAFVRQFVNIQDPPDVDHPTIRVTMANRTVDYPVDRPKADPELYAQPSGALVFASGGRIYAFPWHRIERIEFLAWGE